MSIIKERYESLLRTIPSYVRVVAATKQQPVDAINEAIRAGVSIIGENYVQEAMKKYKDVSKVEWHMIGHLQRNKVKDAVKIFDCIQTVDSLRLAEEIDDQCKKLGKVMQIMIQINIGNEPSKHGIRSEELPNLLERVSKLSNISVKGLMTIEPYFEDPENARQYFRQMRELFELARSYNNDISILSMGMSNSYKVAIEEGSNMIRIGTLLFGPRVSLK